MIIGVMGLSGSGKSTFSAVLQSLGAYLIDADKIAREVVEKGSEGLFEIVSAFGKDILLPDGSLDRKKLGSIVFKDNEKLVMLNQITHRKIQGEIEKRISENKDKLIVIDAPLLHKIDTINMCDEVVLITAPKEALINRIIERDNLPYDIAKARIESQLADYKINSTIIIENNSDKNNLIKKAERLGKGWIK